MKNTVCHMAVLTVCVSFALSACKERKLSVWEEYDVRYPVPVQSGVPVSRANVYNRYNTDNDSYYTKPSTAFGSCSIEDIDEFSCD